MDPLEAILSRSSVRSFEAKPLSGQQEASLIDAALASPSGGNMQPWHFSFVKNTGVLRGLEDFMVELVLRTKDEQAIARLKSRNNKVLFDAPLVVFISSDPKFRTRMIDCGIAVENLAIAAQGLGLGSVILAGGPTAVFTSERKKYFEKLTGIPDGYEFTIAIAIGVPKEHPQPHKLEYSKITTLE